MPTTPPSPAPAAVSGPGRSWSVLLVRCDSRGNYAASGEEVFVNLIELRCDDSVEGARPWYEALAVEIATHVSLEVADDREGTWVGSGR